MATKTKAKLSAIEMHEQIEAHAKQASKSVRIVKAWTKLGQYPRQGDVYLVHADDKTAIVGKKLASRQLALGQSAGSRHIAEGDCALYEAKQVNREALSIRPQAIIFGIVKALKRFIVTHPEHAHDDLPAGTYVVVHQRDWQTQRAVQD